MPRSLRFEYPGAVYHVLNRGNYRSNIFEEEGARRSFRKCLFEACDSAGWILHAFCIMGNHYHLALETPEPNLSAGMKWLQGVFATRFNRFRKERGALFQGRFKSILLEENHLSALCAYIHLNPVRAGLCDVRGLRDYPFSSYWYLRRPRSRPAFLEVSMALDGAGGLADTVYGRGKYEEYLDWLGSDEGARKDLKFDRMSRGWALGTKAFKRTVVDAEKRRKADIFLGEKDYAEVRELLWEEQLEECLKILGKGAAEAESDLKSADWKVAIAGLLKKRHLCANGWISSRLNMGAASAVSRNVAGMFSGERAAAKRYYYELSAKINS
jgi:REP element-mobilizing transposase RayT